MMEDDGIQKQHFSITTRLRDHEVNASMHRKCGKECRAYEYMSGYISQQNKNKEYEQRQQRQRCGEDDGKNNNNNDDETVDDHDGDGDDTSSETTEHIHDITADADEDEIEDDEDPEQDLKRLKTGLDEKDQEIALLRVELEQLKSASKDANDKNNELIVELTNELDAAEKRIAEITASAPPQPDEIEDESGIPTKVLLERKLQKMAESQQQYEQMVKDYNKQREEDTVVVDVLTQAVDASIAAARHEEIARSMIMMTSKHKKAPSIAPKL